MDIYVNEFGQLVRYGKPFDVLALKPEEIVNEFKCAIQLAQSARASESGLAYSRLRDECDKLRRENERLWRVLENSPR